MPFFLDKDYMVEIDPNELNDAWSKVINGLAKLHFKDKRMFMFE